MKTGWQLPQGVDCKMQKLDDGLKMVKTLEGWDARIEWQFEMVQAELKH